MNFKLHTLLITGLALAGSIAAPAAYADKPNLLVVSEDADQETVPRNNRIFNRVIIALAEEMNIRGFTVIDETAAGMNITQPGRVRRSDTELIDVARAIPRPPIDAVVVFQIYSSARQSQYSDIMRPEVRIPGRIIHVRTGQLLGAFEVTGLDLPALPRNCDRECVLEQVGDNARVLARDLGAALATKLAALSGGGGGGAVASDGCDGIGQSFTIVLDGFTNQQVTKVEEYMAAFKCFTTIRPVRGSGSRVEYIYETHTDAARLNRNLRVMLDHMGVPGQIEVAGNTMRVVRIGTR